MEPVKQTLDNLNPEKAILAQKITEPEPTNEEKLEELRKSLGVSSLENTFKNFRLVTGTREARDNFVLLTCGKADFKMLLCYGGVGNGKSHLAEATAIELYKQGIFCRVLTMDRMMAALKGCMDPDKSITQGELLSNYSYTERLIVDDVEGTEWEFEQLEKIIRIRYRENLFTILTTNRDLNELPTRLVSRFRDATKGRVVLNQGKDYRPDNKR